MSRREASELSEQGDPGESVLGRGARVRGRIGGDGDLRVEGHVEGDVRISGQLAIEEGGTVTGDVEAAAVTISGALTGEIAARGLVTIRAGAKVEGSVTGRGSEVVLEEGASFEGRIDAEFDLPAELTAGPAHEASAVNAGGSHAGGSHAGGSGGGARQGGRSR